MCKQDFSENLTEKWSKTRIQEKPEKVGIDALVWGIELVNGSKHFF